MFFDSFIFFVFFKPRSFLVSGCYRCSHIQILQNVFSTHTCDVSTPGLGICGSNSELVHHNVCNIPPSFGLAPYFPVKINLCTVSCLFTFYLFDINASCIAFPLFCSMLVVRFFSVRLSFPFINLSLNLLFVRLFSVRLRFPFINLSLNFPWVFDVMSFDMRSLVTKCRKLRFCLIQPIFLKSLPVFLYLIYQKNFLVEYFCSLSLRSIFCLASLSLCSYFCPVRFCIRIVLFGVLSLVPMPTGTRFSLFLFSSLFWYPFLN